MCRCFLQSKRVSLFYCSSYNKTVHWHCVDTQHACVYTHTRTRTRISVGVLKDKEQYLHQRLHSCLQCLLDQLSIELQAEMFEYSAFGSCTFVFDAAGKKQICAPGDLSHFGFCLLFKRTSNKANLQIMYFNGRLAAPFHVHRIFCGLFKRCARICFICNENRGLFVHSG